MRHRNRSEVHRVRYAVKRKVGKNVTLPTKQQLYIGYSINKYFCMLCCKEEIKYQPHHYDI